MGVIGAEQPLCSCYKECQEFHKVIELKDTGLVVYCHTTCREDVIQGGVVGSAISTSQDVFILQNTKDVKITSADLLPALEKNDISCPRCRQLFEHAQELLQKVTLIDKKNVMGICDQCRLKIQFNKKTCSECEAIVKKFLSVKSEQNEDTKRFIKIWLSKMKHLFKEEVPSDKPKHHRARACSELRIDRLCQYSPRSTREPIVKQMFHSEIHKSDTNLYTDMTDAKLNEQQKLEKAVIFTEPVEPLEVPYVGEQLKMSRPDPSHPASDATLVEPNEEDKDRPKILKERRGKPDHISEYSTKKIIYDIPKIAPWEQQEPSEHESAMDVKIATKNNVKTLESESRNLRSTSQKPNKYELPRTSQKISETYVGSITDMKEPSKQKHDLTSKHMIPKKEKIEHAKLKKATDDSEISTKVLKQEHRYLTDDEIKFQRSVSKFNHEMEKTGQREMKTTTKGKKPIQFEEPPENIVRKQFSYFFPKGKEARKPQLGARSSQLIKNTQEKYRQRDEDEKRKHEEERIKKLEEDEKNRLAREEKKRLADEKRKQAEEQKKLEGQKKMLEELQRKKHDEELEKKLLSEKEKKILDGDKNQEEPIGDKTKKSKEKRDTMPGSKQKGEKEKDLKDTQKGLKQTIEFEKETGKAKKDIKGKSEPKDKLDEEKQRTTKESKPKPEKSYEVPEKSKKDLKSKTEMKEIIDKEAKKEKEKKESKSKTEQKDKIEKQKKDEVEMGKKDEVEKVKKEAVDKVKKEAVEKEKIEPVEKVKKEGVDKEKEKLKSKTELKDTIDKEAEKRQKEKDMQALKEQLQREKEEKDKSNQMEQLRKEKEAASSKKQDSPKESAKNNLEPIKEKKISPKKMEDLPKEIEDLSKKSKETKTAPQKLQDVSKQKEEPSTKQQVPPTEIEKIKQDLIKEKEGKAKTSPKTEDKSKDDTIKNDGASKKAKEDKSKPSEESKQDKNKGEDASKKTKEDKSKAIKESKEDTSKVQATSKKEKDGMDEAEFRKLQADLAKQKEEDLKRKRQNEADEQKARELADKKAKEEGEGKLKKMREAKAEIKPELKRRSVEKKDKPEESTIKELKLNQIKMRRRSSDDLILQLVKIKQTATGGRIKTRPCDIDPAVIQSHKLHQKSGLFSSACDLCNDSELEIDVESYDNKINLKASVEEIIIGEKILKYKGPILEETEQEVIPMLFKSVFQGDTAPLPLKDIVTIIPEEPAPEKKILAALLPKKDTKGEQVEESGKGIIRYALSDRTFIDKGWTMLPTEKVVRKMNVYRMRPAHPEFDWFEHNKNKRLMTYDTGEKLAEFDDNGRGRWYYRSGRLALDYYDAEETNAQQRFVVYSSGEPDERGRTHPFTILATFDYLGNGIVFDHAGKIRLKYNQTEGVVLDRGIGPVSHWKWHTLNDPPVLQQVMIDTQMAHKDPQIFKLGSPADVKTRPDNEEMLAIEFDNFIKEKSKKLSQKFKPFQIKMKALKINEHFSLKVLDQATIYLIYRDGSTNLKLNIGMILDHQEIVDTDTAEVGEVSNNLERFPARTDSLAGLQRSVAYAQRYERQRTERERRLRPSAPCASADQLTAAASSPLRPPLRTMPAGSTSSGLCKCRKPSSNLYYNTRLL